MATLKAVKELLPSISFLVWYTVLIVYGLYAVNEDWTLEHTSCGETTHLLKFSLLNIVFAFFTCFSYLLFPGGGEGARARALVITAFHFGFTIWGVLLWTSLSSKCASTLPELYQAVYILHHILVVHNAVFLTLMIVHEVYLGEKLESDYTLMAEFPPHGYARSSSSPHYVGPHPHQPGSPGPPSPSLTESQTNLNYPPVGSYPEISTHAMAVSSPEHSGTGVNNLVSSTP